MYPSIIKIGLWNDNFLCMPLWFKIIIRINGFYKDMTTDTSFNHKTCRQKFTFLFFLFSFKVSVFNLYFTLFFFLFPVSFCIFYLSFAFFLLFVPSYPFIFSLWLFDFSFLFSLFSVGYIPRKCLHHFVLGVFRNEHKVKINTIRI